MTVTVQVAFDLFSFKERTRSLLLQVSIVDAENGQSRGELDGDR